MATYPTHYSAENVIDDAVALLVDAGCPRELVRVREDYAGAFVLYLGDHTVRVSQRVGSMAVPAGFLVEITVSTALGETMDEATFTPNLAPHAGAVIAAALQDVLPF